jgi:hypothetical protein
LPNSIGSTLVWQMAEPCAVLFYLVVFDFLTIGTCSGLDFAPVDTHLKDDTPIVVVQHGLTGGEIKR